MSQTENQRGAQAPQEGEEKMSVDAKLLRKQLRNVVQEAFPQLLSQELATEIQKVLLNHLDKRLDAIDQHVKSQLEAIDQRAKDLQAYLVRNNTEVKPPHV